MASNRDSHSGDPRGILQATPRITVVGVGGAGGNAVNNMINAQLEGVEFLVCNTDNQALAQSLCQDRVQLGRAITQGLGAGAKADIGRAAAEEVIEELIDYLKDSHMVFVTCGMGGGTGTGAAPVIARAAREQGILTVGVVTKPFQFEGSTHMRVADTGIEELQEYVDTLIVIPNQNLFRIANEHTTFADAFKMADDVLYCGVRGVTDLIVNPGLVNLDFADIRTIMSEMGKAMMGTGEADGDKRAIDAAEAAINNPLLDEVSMKGARAVLINITGGMDITLYEVDEATQRIRAEVEEDANIIWGSALDPTMEGRMRVSVVATGMDAGAQVQPRTQPQQQTVHSGLSAAHPNAGNPGGGGGPRGGRPQAAPAPQPAANAVSTRQQPRTHTAAQLAAAMSERKAAEAARQAADVGLPAEAEEPTFAESQLQPQRAAPPPPVPRPQAQPQRAQPAAQQRPAPAPGPAEDAKPRGRTSLFQRVTGGRPPQTAAQPEPAPRPAAPAPRTAQPQQPAAGQQERLGGLDPTERLPASRKDEDLLDIPAFLRRQAN